MIEWLIIIILFILLAILFNKYSKVILQIEKKAQEQFEKWKQTELNNIKKQIEEVIEGKYKNLFEQWKQEEEKRIREDAIQKSQAVTLGKVTEHIIPYFPEFKYNPKDVRFIGTPIDLIVFDGLADDEVKKIVMVEVKTGKTANLTSKERQIENCVKEGNVYFEVIHHKEWYEQYNEDVNSLENKEEIEPYLSKCPKCGAENSKPLKTWTLRPEKNEPIVVGLYKCENCGAFYRDSVPIN